MSVGTVHENLPIERYFALPGESATALKDVLVSPLLYDWRQREGRPDKDTLRLGRAIHTAVLEPQRFRAEYAVWPAENGARRGKAWDAFRVEHAARTILTEAQVDAALKVADAIRNHAVASKLLGEAGGKPELSITWRHERTGLMCKARIDWLCSALVDLKTCREVVPEMFGSQAARLRHHVQLAHYGYALDSLGLRLPAKLIAAQNQPPYDVAVFRVDDDALVIGEQLVEAALDKIVACRESGMWPGVAWDAELVLKLPAWAVSDGVDALDLTAGGEPLFGEGA